MNDVNTYYIRSALSCIDQKSIEELNQKLQNICDKSLYYNYCTGCPVYQYNNEIPNKQKTKYGCDCFMDGEKMRQYIIKHYS